LGLSTSVAGEFSRTLLSAADTPATVGRAIKTTEHWTMNIKTLALTATLPALLLAGCSVPGGNLLQVAIVQHACLQGKGWVLE
jgi:hypothetical protein